MGELGSIVAGIFEPHAFLESASETMGAGLYALLFAIIFAETGLVVTPFLPGDSLLFAAGAIAAVGHLDIRLMVGLLVAAAILGDAVNYAVGRRFGSVLMRRESRWIKREYFDQAVVFFERHGGKAIVMARFVPIVRTFVPFVAGMCGMRLARFWTYNISGAIVWVVLFAGAGYLFGNLPWVEENLTLGMLVIVALSVLPIVVEAVRLRAKAAASRRAALEVEGER